jgi:hypothetical protein
MYIIHVLNSFELVVIFRTSVEFCVFALLVLIGFVIMILFSFSLNEI